MDTTKNKTAASISGQFKIVFNTTQNNTGNTHTTGTGGIIGKPTTKTTTKTHTRPKQAPTKRKSNNKGKSHKEQGKPFEYLTKETREFLLAHVAACRFKQKKHAVANNT